MQVKFALGEFHQTKLSDGPSYSFALREGCRKKNAAKLWSFTKPGGGVSEGNKKPDPFFGKSIFSSELVESF